MLSRRHSLAVLGSASAAGLLPGAVPFALAAPSTDRRLVVVILRGAIDGLAAIPPYGDPAYRSQRGKLALDAPGADNGTLDLDGRFGLHPSLKPLHDMYRSRELVAFHAIATPYRKRSHFDGQDLLENGTASPNGVRDGWLNRALSLFEGGDRRIGLAVGQTVPLILRGDTPVQSWMPRKLRRADDDFLTRLSELYQQDPLLGPAMAEAIGAQEMSDEVLGRDMGKKGKKLRRAGALPNLAKNVSKLLRHDQGARIAVLEVGGWDTHANQGVLTGRLARNLSALAAGVDELKTGLGPVWSKSAVLVVSEFGRTVRPNGTNGTDHGTGGIALLAGGAVAGGKVVTKWPGLSDGSLYQGRDLAPTRDLRSVLKAVAVDHLGLPADAVEQRVFPDSTVAARDRRLFRP